MKDSSSKVWHASNHLHHQIRTCPIAHRMLLLWSFGRESVTRGNASHEPCLLLQMMIRRCKQSSLCRTASIPLQSPKDDTRKSVSKRPKWREGSIRCSLISQHLPGALHRRRSMHWSNGVRRWTRWEDNFGMRQAHQSKRDSLLFSVVQPVFAKTSRITARACVCM